MLQRRNASKWMKQRSNAEMAVHPDCGPAGSGSAHPLAQPTGPGTLAGRPASEARTRHVLFPLHQRHSHVAAALAACLAVWSMNKAFVKETDAADADEDDVAAPALPVGSKNYMTPAGYAQLDAEFNQLWKVERAQLGETISWVAENA